MSTVMSLIVHYSILMNFDPAISLAVARQESNFNPTVIGDLGEIGLFQVRPEFIENYSRKELSNTEVNIKVGIGLLKLAKENCVHKKDLTWLVCYNAGVAGGNKYKYPNLAKYVINVSKHYKEFKNVYANSLREKRRNVACY